MTLVLVTALVYRARNAVFWFLVTALVYRARNAVVWFLVAAPWSTLLRLLRRGLFCCDCCPVVSFERLVGVLGMSMYTLMALQLRSGALKLLLLKLLLLFSSCYFDDDDDDDGCCCCCCCY